MQVLYCLRHPLSPFCSGYFGAMSYFLSLLARTILFHSTIAGSTPSFLSLIWGLMKLCSEGDQELEKRLDQKELT
jgi:hypothetical protein